MPAEAMRLERRLGTRDRWFLALLVCAAMLASIGAVLIGRSGEGGGSSRSRCVTVLRASIMGGATFTYCGADAVAFCRRSAATDRDLASQCAGLETAATAD